MMVSLDLMVFTFIVAIAFFLAIYFMAQISRRLGFGVSIGVPFVLSFLAGGGAFSGSESLKTFAHPVVFVVVVAVGVAGLFFSLSQESSRLLLECLKEMKKKE